MKLIIPVQSQLHTFEKKVMQFGNWLVTETAIEWKGGNYGRLSIPIHELDRTVKSDNDDGLFYEWILLATRQDWLTQNDLFDMNYAYVWAFAKSGLVFNYDIFDATLEEQFDQFDDEDNEDFEL